MKDETETEHEFLIHQQSVHVKCNTFTLHTSVTDDIHFAVKEVDAEKGRSATINTYTTGDNYMYNDKQSTEEKLKLTICCPLEVEYDLRNFKIL